MAEPLVPVSPDQAKLPDLRLTMRGAMDKLEAKNAELGGRMFGVFGGKEIGSHYFSIEDQTFSTRCFIFKTPITRGDSSADGVDEFLVVTEDGFKLIQMDQGGSFGEGKGFFKNLLVEYIEDAQMHQPGEGRRGMIDYRSSSGYLRRHGIVLPASPHAIRARVLNTGKHLIGWQQSVYANRELPSVRLVGNIDPDTALEIIRVNRERAEQEQAQEAGNEEEKAGLAKRREEMLQSVDPSLIVAQRMGEVLG